MKQTFMNYFDEPRYLQKYSFLRPFFQQFIKDCQTRNATTLEIMQKRLTQYFFNVCMSSLSQKTTVNNDANANCRWWWSSRSNSFYKYLQNQARQPYITAEENAFFCLIYYHETWSWVLITNMKWKNENSWETPRKLNTCVCIILKGFSTNQILRYKLIAWEVIVVVKKLSIVAESYYNNGKFNNISVILSIQNYP